MLHKFSKYVDKLKNTKPFFIAKQSLSSVNCNNVTVTHIRISRINALLQRNNVAATHIGISSLGASHSWKAYLVSCLAYFFCQVKKYLKKMVKNTKFIFETSHCKAENLRAIADLTQNADPHLFKAFCQIGFCVSCHQKAGYDPGAKSHLIMDLAP